MVGETGAGLSCPITLPWTLDPGRGANISRDGHRKSLHFEDRGTWRDKGNKRRGWSGLGHLLIVRLERRLGAVGLLAWNGGHLDGDRISREKERKTLVIAKKRKEHEKSNNRR